MNRQKSKKVESIVETTFDVIQRAAGEPNDQIEMNDDHYGEPTVFGETIHRQGGELFDITGIQPQINETYAQIADIPAPLPPPLNAPVKEFDEGRTISKENVQKKATKKVKIVSKRKLVIDEIKLIPEAEMIKRMKNTKIQSSDIEKVTVHNKLPKIDLFRINNRDMRKRKLIN
jgi:hypothetical protein